ncbi:hypothetical protein IHE44_0001186 [Lamprotornis superbus]|uniref:Frizzled-6 n=1 Tax=Lamprotornis superbus TaxID=245042 RepID=A0A835P0Y1_9PASS|nr:hypothetical protein IHE44_0001186 [Lamprotornis superbus]
MKALVFSATFSLLLALVQGHSLFTCEPITISRCSGMPYNMTFFPNIMGHYDQDTAARKMDFWNVSTGDKPLRLPDVGKIHASVEVQREKACQHLAACRPDPEGCTTQGFLGSAAILCPLNTDLEALSSRQLLARTAVGEALLGTVQLISHCTLGCAQTLFPALLINCDETAPATAAVTTNVHGTQKTPSQIRRDYGFWCPRHLHTTNGQGYKFLGIDQCAPPCPNIIVSLMYFIGFLLGNKTACNEADDKLEIAGIISLNHVRQVIQHDGRNQEKLKKFMIRIGVFSGLYLVPLVALLGCYVYELVNRKIWETTWAKALARPEIFLFLMKYLLTLIVGISPVFWVGSKKTCSEWANFFNRNRKRDPISESRRVLQESCEFFLRHNSKVKHKKKHYKSTSHRLKVISKSMGTSTGGTTNHGTSAVAITNHDYLSQEAMAEIKTSPETSEKEIEAEGASARRVEEGENSGDQMLSSAKLSVDQVERRNKADGTCHMSTLAESIKRVESGYSQDATDLQQLSRELADSDRCNGVAEASSPLVISQHDPILRKAVGKIILRKTPEDVDSCDEVLYGEKWTVTKSAGKPKKTCVSERLCEGESSSSCSKETALLAAASPVSICSARCIDCATVTLCEPAQAVQEQTGHLGDFISPHGASGPRCGIGGFLQRQLLHRKAVTDCRANT